MTGYTTSTLKKAKHLRREMTEAEKRLWSRLRNAQLGVKFRRQQPIGPFIADFLCAERRLIVEVDGGQHLAKTSDDKRTAWLNQRGYLVIRLWNHDVLNNLQGVLETISATLKTPHPPIAPQWAPPSPSGGEGTLDGASLG